MVLSTCVRIFPFTVRIVGVCIHDWELTIASSSHMLKGTMNHCGQTSSEPDRENNSPAPGDCLRRDEKRGGRTPQPSGKAVLSHTSPNRDGITKVSILLPAARINTESINHGKDGESTGNPSILSHIRIPIHQHSCLPASCFLHKADAGCRP